MIKSGARPFSELSYPELLELGYAIVGSAATVRRKLKEMAATLGFGNLCAVLQIGDMPFHRTIKNMELFATEVMPAFERDRSTPTSRLQAAV
jgi:hypothetical protein